ncbi:hypothetical protein QMK19_38555 [Streptomyces sp. H10-C2]|uniref:hypothetical protein n=1 Tax=unclassified Streptomyces TaxID=2593676 RepID=UPI0024B9DAAD|nr:MULTISPECIES: hypothetical protein [unclassified Streptomyces]MDJ0347110.1 hypothetical protein [Streptomyces sp. PH10-H1]MDJ0375341.1 hypothetical protein [Streptomyces sp. H10-C2]
MRDLDEFEDTLIERFKEHPVLANITRLPDEDFAAVLLQRRFVSLAFTPSYDLAIDLLSDEAGLRIARIILREEYPDSHGHTRSHREDMTEDLRRLGVSRAALVGTRPTAATKRAINDTLELIADAGGHDNADLRLLTILRFWGEVLVSVEYGRLWERMEPLLTRDGENRSRFYYPHHVHDAKTHSLATVSCLSGTHSDRLATRVTELLAREESTDCFKELEERALQLKVSFYDQFLPALDRVGV